MIEIVGFSVERFLNLAVHRDIYVWNIDRQGHKMTMNVSIAGYKMLKLCARKTGCKIKIKRKVGLPFFAYRYRKRKMLLLGIIFFICLIYIMASFVWLIEVDGNEKVTSQEIVDQLAENGYKIGQLKHKMDLRSAEQTIMTGFPDILWTGISFEGTKLMVHVTEIVPEPPLVDYSSPTHLVAKADALILDIITRKGTPLVKKGDTVRKGDTLVSGEILIGEDEDGEGEMAYVRASADIIAKTRYEFKIQIPMEKVYKDYMEWSKRGYALRLFDKKINIYQPRVEFKYYDYVIKSKQLQVTSKFPLPFYWIEEEYIAYAPKLAIISDETAQDKLTIMLEQLLKQTIHENGKIVNRQVEFIKKNKEMIGRLQAIIEEELGTELLIQRDNGGNKNNDKQSAKY